MKWLLFLPLIFIFGCGILLSDMVNFEIDENNFVTASRNHPEKIVKFNDKAVPYDELDSFLIYEVNAKQIRNLSKKYSNTWVHIWLPTCPNDLCQNIDFFQRLVDSAKKDGLEFLMVSSTYDLTQIDTIAKHAQFRYPIYVIEDQTYGHKLTPARKKFARELGADADHSDYLFNADSLVFMGDISSQAMLDSLMRK